MVKNVPANAGDAGSIFGSGRSPGEGHGNPLHSSSLGNPTLRNVAGYCPRGCKRVGNDLVTKQQEAAVNGIWGVVFLIRIIRPVAMAPDEKQWGFVCLQRSECCYSKG